MFLTRMYFFSIFVVLLAFQDCTYLLCLNLQSGLLGFPASPTHVAYFILDM